MTPYALGLCLLLMLGSFFAMAHIERRALGPALTTAAILTVACGFVAYLFTL